MTAALGSRMAASSSPSSGARSGARVVRIAIALVVGCLVALIAAPAAGAQTGTAPGSPTPAATTTRSAPPADGAAATTARPTVAPQTTLPEVEKELMCSTCRVPLNQSDAPQAQQERQTIERLIAEGMTKDEIIDEMVRIYSETVLIDPPEANVRTLRWLVPALAALLGFSLLTFLVLRWRRTTRPSGSETAVDPTAGWIDAPGDQEPDDAALPDHLTDADRRRLDADLDRYA